MASAEVFEEGGSWLRRPLLYLAAILVAGGVGAGVYFWQFAGSSASSADTRPETATVSRGQLVSSFSTTGTANATLNSKLTFSGTGQVKSVSVAVGDKVTTGQELGRLDDRDAQRKLDTAKANLQVAQLKLQQMKEPPAAADVAAARQSVTSAQAQETSAQQSYSTAQQAVTNAQSQLATAQANLDKANQPPAASDIAAADAAVTQAQTALQNAKNGVDSAWTALVNAQRGYCSQQEVVVHVCYADDIPLRDTAVSDLQNVLHAPSGTAAEINALVSAINSLLQANTSYLNSQGSVTSAQAGLTSAQAKRTALDAPPSADVLAPLQAAVATAQGAITTAQGNVTTAYNAIGVAHAGVISAEAKLDQLMAGSTATDIALQEQSVQLAQISLQQAQDAMDDLVLKAPFDGEIGSIGVNVGDQVGASTAAFTLTNPGGIRVDLVVSETDVASLKAGQFGIATFDAMPNQFYVVRIIGVSTTPTTAQGVVTYPVQAEILHGDALTQAESQLTQLVSALQSLAGSAASGGGGANAGGAAGGGFGGRGGAGTFQGGGANRQGQQGTPRASRTPNPDRTPGASTTPGAFRNGQGGAGLLQALANAPLPTPGMTANVAILLNVQQDALLVPSTAIRRQGRSTYVNVVESDGTTEQRPVTTGGTNDRETVITAGLAEGDVILATAPSTGTVSSATPFSRQPTPAGGVR